MEMRGVTFEDNLSSHHTDATMDFWRSELPHFEEPRFVPAKMTEIIQVIDRHIGVQYKRAVYLAFRKELMRRLRKAREEAGTSVGVKITPMAPREKRILITKSVAEEHEKLLKSGAYERAFIATATWLPISHLVRDSNGVCHGPATIAEESQVELQHLPEYKYTDQCRRDSALAYIDALKQKEEEERAEKERIAIEERQALAVEEHVTQQYTEKAASLMPAITNQLATLVIDPLKLVHEETGYEKFIVGGSWVSEKICDAISVVCKDDTNVDLLAMSANDLDLYWGTFTDDPEKKLSVDLTQVRYKTIAGLATGKACELDRDYLNTVKCSNLNANTLLSNNDLNITATCLDVEFTRDELSVLHASPSFWKFLFQKSSERKIETVNTINTSSYDATSCVRIAYKAFDLRLEYSLGKLDPTVGTIAASNKAKFDKMKGWPDSPFHEYQCNKRGNCFIIVKKHKKVACANEECNGWANKNCSYSMCKKCCIAHTSAPDGHITPCRVKDHKCASESN